MQRMQASGNGCKAITGTNSKICEKEELLLRYYKSGVDVSYLWSVSLLQYRMYR